MYNYMKTIFVNGTFDILHSGHVKMLNYARSLGDELIVAVDSDERVRNLKSEKRPINKLEDRLFLLSNLKSVNSVISFNSDQELIDLVQKCDIIVKGDDYKNKDFVEKIYCKEIRYYDRTEHSTTKTIQDIINR
jgi:rfaE bifunctional protein nucleotidyltransferase chain/domain